MQSAFDTLAAKKATAEQKDLAHRITPGSKIVGEGEQAQLLVSFPLTEIAKSKISKGEKGAIGFVCAPIAFTVNGQTFEIRPGWTSLVAK